MAQHDDNTKREAAAEEAAAVEEARRRRAGMPPPAAGERPHAATGARQVQTGPKPREDYSAALPKFPHATDKGETAFTDAEVPPAGPAEPAKPGDPAAAAEAKAAEYLALAQRTQADFENYRKRAAREAQQASDRGLAKLAKELLPALDHLELALRHVDEAGGDAAEVARGFRLVHEEIVNALKRVGIQPFSPVGERFDPTEHEAMAQQPREGAESGTVIEVYQQGYRLNGAVLRPARVVVAA
jgi:molecular chaperone GrpE